MLTPICRNASLASAPPTQRLMVMRADGVIELHEVKGSLRIFQEDAKVKAKVCAAMYPFPVKVVWPRRKKDGGGWEEMQY